MTSIPVTLRWSDLDAFGYISNISVLTVLQDAGLALLGNSMPRGVVIASRRTTYKHRVHPGPATAEACVSHVAATWFQVRLTLHQNDKYNCVTDLVDVLPLSDTRRKLTYEERVFLEDHLEGGPLPHMPELPAI